MRRTELLVTGASGFLGSHIMHQSPSETSIGIFQTNRPADDGHNYLQLDLTETNRVVAALKKYKPKALIHCAAKINIDWCEKHPQQAWLLNAELPATLAKACAELDCKFVFVSSDMVFDGEKGEYRESDSINPISYYGRAKAAAERAVLQACPQAIVARVALIYGLPVSTGRGSSFLTWVLDRLEAGLQVPLFVDQYRTPVEVSELAETLLILSGSDFQGIIHIAGGEKIDRYAFGEIVCGITGQNPALLQKSSYRDTLNDVLRPRDLSMRTDLLCEIIGHRLSHCGSALRRILIKQ
ncbi:MAG: SDR family oxidoreductase [Deferribacteres bacterium]|nr:SDR family oxidoreductase [candidate division KSB1 bacterium]MCB9510905.1 SDR family oxidoreductase [Deferribacteres bacterium]